MNKPSWDSTREAGRYVSAQNTNIRNTFRRQGWTPPLNGTGDDMATWSKLQPAALPDEHYTTEHWLKRGMQQQEAEATVRGLRMQRIYINNLYQVNMSDAQELGLASKHMPACWHLSIKRRDKKSIHDWRHLQRIKNELVGKNHEGFELYPAESRLHDTVNQYHLFVFKEEHERIPVGWTDRDVDYNPHRTNNTGQRAQQEGL